MSSVRNMGVNIADILPKPKGNKSRWADDDEEEEAPAKPSVSSQRKQPPPQGKRQGWVPRSTEDFADGGAFPEIHAAQYPLDMGRKGGKSEKTIGLQMDAAGNIKYDAILNQGRDSKAIAHVQSTARDLVAKKAHEMDVDKPDEEEVMNKTMETQMALEKIINGKLSAAKVARPEMNQKKDAEYIRYIPSKAGGETNSGARERIIKMHEAPVDPLELPKFKHKKAPRGPPSPPVPVMHSPPRKVSGKDMADWKIPPCVSNWKNAKGYTIPLDKRLAADGRGHSQVVINDKFAQFSESLLIAQEVAREGISARIKERERQQRLDKEKKDEELRQLARDARMMRTGAAVPASLSASGGGGGADGGGRGGRGKDSDSDSDASGDSPPRAAPAPDTFERETREERDARRQRDEIRDDRRREREREKRLEELERKGVKKSKLTRDRDRDVSEKIALGLAQPSGQEMQFDQRLFNQSAGMDSGFGAEDGYNLYDGRLFEGSSANKVYRPQSNAKDLAGDEDITEATLKQARFKVDNEFSGASGTDSKSRSGPVEFDKDSDVFGLDEFMSAAKKSRTK